MPEERDRVIRQYYLAPHFWTDGGSGRAGAANFVHDIKELIEDFKIPASDALSEVRHPA